MDYISSYMPTSFLGKWLFGASMVPLELTLREIFLTAAKSGDLCTETQIEYYKRNFQKIEYKENLIFLNQTSKIKRFMVEKLLSLFQANNGALVEESIFRFGVQYCVFTVIPSYFNKSGEISEEEQLLQIMVRVIGTAALFGLLHYKGAQVRNDQKEHAASKEEVRKERNFQVIGACVSGIVYGAAYEITNQSLWASHGCHALWNFVHDLIVSNTWEKEPLKLELAPIGAREKSTENSKRGFVQKGRRGRRK